MGWKDNTSNNAMGWKDINYKREGAIIGATIGILVAIFLSSNLFCKLSYEGYFRFLGLPSFPNGCGINNMSNEVLGFLNPIYTFIVFVLFVLIGYFVGLIIGKNK